MILLDSVFFSERVISSVITSLITLFTALLTVYYGMKKFNKQRIDELDKLSLQKQNELSKMQEQSEQERLMKFWELQLTLYMEASKCASIMVNHQIDSKEFRKAKSRFWELYWGELAVIETEEVELAMVNFGEKLFQYENDKSKLNELRDAAYILAHSCRKSSRLWNYTEMIRIQENKEV